MFLAKILIKITLVSIALEIIVLKNSLISQCCAGNSKSEPVFVNVYGAKESIPPGWKSIPGTLKGLQIRALVIKQRRERRKRR